ncbi:hypothetical protein F5Y14DRAFT_406253 [Nemania sp. NC0429]|nr:hypothetical protein F5Y14DRAFT_406253 [Nemania sp. NC0429]
MPAPIFWAEEGGVWRRRLGGMEKFYLTLASPEGEPVHWMVGCCVSFSYHGNDDVDIAQTIRRAWIATQLGLPSVASTIDRARGEIVVASDTSSSGIDEWLSRSFKVHDDASASADDLFSGFRSQLHITLHFLRGPSQLLIQAPHALLDGRGSLHLLHALFTALAHPDSAAQSSVPVSSASLTSPYDTWLGLSPQIPAEKDVQAAQSIFRTVMDQKQPIRLPGVNFDSLPRRALHVELIMTENITESIIAACKQRGVTVTSAWHAALAMATKAIQSAAGESGTSFVQFTTIDLRRWFPPHFRPRQDSIGSLQTALPFALDLGADDTFEALSQTLHGRGCYGDPFAFAEGDFNYLTPYMAASTQLLEAGGAVPPSSTPSLSSMGVIDHLLPPAGYGAWEPTGFWISSTMLTADIQMYLWTFRGRLTFSVCYNEGFYGVGEVDALLEETRSQLLTGLGIDA